MIKVELKNREDRRLKMIEVSYAIFVFDLFYYLGNQLQLSLYVEGFVKYTTQYMNNPLKKNLFS